MVPFPHILRLHCLSFLSVVGSVSFNWSIPVFFQRVFPLAARLLLPSTVPCRLFFITGVCAKPGELSSSQPGLSIAF